MKYYFILFFLLGGSLHMTSQNKDYSQKVKTIDNTIATLYKVISGEKGEKRDWKLFEYLFHKDAKLIPSGNNRQGVYRIFREVASRKWFF